MAKKPFHSDSDDSGTYGLRPPRPAPPPPETPPAPVLNYQPGHLNAPSAMRQFFLGAGSAWLTMGSLLIGMYTLNDESFSGLVMLYFLAPVALLLGAGMLQARREWMSILPGTFFGIGTMLAVGCVCWMKAK